MNNYLLLDGALIPGQLEQVSGFQSPKPWHAGLLPGNGRLAGPVLLSQQQLTQAGHDASHTFASWLKAYPGRLHASLIDSPLALEPLARHLAQHLHIITSDGLPLLLRLADCRVLAMLPSVLTPEQWQQLTAPLGRWHIHGRDGKTVELTVPAEPGDAAPDDTQLRLSDAQIAQLADLSEPDAVLAAIGRTPEHVPVADLEWAHTVARHCIHLWQKHGHTSREVLYALTRRGIDSGGQLFKQPDELSRLLGAA